jgi:hypothetical protein
VRLCYTSQTLAEFWNASTRPLDKNGFGLNVAETDRQARVIERDFEFLPDSREIHDRWRSLQVAHSIQGVQVHAPRLAASMYVHGVGQLTINVRDFKRFQGCVFSIQPNSLAHNEHTTTALLGSNFDGNWGSIVRGRHGNNLDFSWMEVGKATRA